MDGFEEAKSLSPNGWTMEFFLEFFDMLGEELLVVVEESRLQGKVCLGLNENFINMIPKKEKHETFKYFRPFSLCNLVYKIIKKIIANRIESVLSKFMSMEQFGFLDSRHIVDAIGVGKEGLHNIKVKKMKYLVLKLELIKAHCRVSYLDFLRLVLLQIGLSLEEINWIIWCITSTNFFVLVNKEPTNFFRSSRGLRQGFLMPPLPFLLLVECLRRLIYKEKEEGRIEGIKIARFFIITHLLFVVVVVLFGRGNIQEWLSYKDILDLLNSSFGMVVSESKFVYLEYGLDALNKGQI